MLVESVVYADSRRTATATPGEACQACREPGKFAWVTLREPSREEFVSVAGEFGLDELVMEEAIEPGQRPKIERYGKRLFVVLKSARYVEGTGRIEFGEVHAFVEPDFIVTVLYGEDPALDGLREEVEGEPQQLRRGPSMVLYEIMYRIVEGYAPVIDGLENDLDEVEAEVLGAIPGSRTGCTGSLARLSGSIRQPSHWPEHSSSWWRAPATSIPRRTGTCATSATGCCGRRSRSRDCEICSLASST